MDLYRVYEDMRLAVHCMAFSPDGEWLAVGSEQCKIHLFDKQFTKVYSRQCYQGLIGNLEFSSRWSKGPLTLASITLRKVTLWDMGLNELVSFDCTHYGDFTFAFTGDLLAFTEGRRALKVWNVANKVFIEYPFHVYCAQNAWAVAISNDNDFLASFQGKNKLCVWNTNVVVDDTCCDDSYLQPFIKQDCEFVTKMEFSPSCKLLAYVANNEHYETSLHVLNIETQQALQLCQNTGGVYSLSFSPDDSQLVTCCSGMLKFWDVRSGQLIKTTAGRDAIFHPNGKQLVVVPDDNKGLCISTFCKWSERTHHLFSRDLRQRVFCFLCVRHRSEKENLLPRLPMELWLEIFKCIAS